MQDLSPNDPKLISADKEITIPFLFQDTPLQTVAGWQAGSSELKSGNVSIQATNERILLGNATEPLSGVGVFIGNDKAGGYDFRAGDPSGNYIHWDASAATLTIIGNVTATAGTIGGWSISANAIYYDGATDAVSAGMAPADYPFYAGKKYVDRATAPYRVSPSGALFASSVEVTGKITAGVGSSVDFSYVAGATKPADNATVNATFKQDAIPTSLAIGDLWIDTNDGNKLYRAESVGADQIVAGEWVLVTDTVVDDGVAPAAPSGLTASAGIQAVFLKWTWNTETDMDHYDIYRHTADVQGSAVKIASVKVNMMFDSGLTAATPYYYWIKAVDRKGNASGFNASAGTTATPRNVGEADVSDDAITALKINVAQLSAIAADLGAVTAGSIVGISLNIPNADTPLFSVDADGNTKVSSLARDDYHWFTIFESVDSFLKAGTVTATEDYVEITTGITTNDLARLRKSASNSNNFSWDKKRKIKFGIIFQNNTRQDIFLVSGSGSIAAATERRIGFEVGNATLYGVVANGSTLATINLEVSIATGTIYDLEVVFGPGVGVTFYVNGINKGTITSYLPSGTASSTILMECQIRTSENASKTAQLTYVDFWQEK